MKVDPKTVAIPDAPAAGEVDGAASDVTKVVFASTGNGPTFQRWEVNVYLGKDTKIRFKVHTPLKAGGIFTADNVQGADTELTLGGQAQRGVDSVYRLELTKFDAKPWTGLSIDGGKVSGRFYVGVRYQGTKEGGASGTFTDATIQYSADRPLGQ